MHHALEVQEILSNVFALCCSDLCSGRTVTPDLLALAQTCCACKEPALDALWKELRDPSPIVRCIPEASRALFTTETDVEGAQSLSTGNKYCFTRPLTPEEWGILRSHTRRIWSLVDNFNRCTLDEKSFRVLSNPPSTVGVPLFPNLRHLRCEYAAGAASLSHLSLPSLISLDLVLDGPSVFQVCLESKFPGFSPDVRILSMCVRNLGDTFIKIEYNYISRWQNLHSVDCPQIDLDAYVLAHLSRMSALTRLTFKLTVILPDTDPYLLFSNLRDLTLYSGSLRLISHFLSRVRLPAITDISVVISGRPSKIKLSSFMTGILSSNANRTMQSLMLRRRSPTSINALRNREVISLDLEDLQPCMAFSNLRYLMIDLGWNVCLTDRAVLELVSAWPQLENLFINMDSGWNVPGGVTPNGLLRLLETCTSLHGISLALDTRGYTTTSLLSEPMVIPGWTLTLPRVVTIDVIDSKIEEESVPVVAEFFAALVPRPRIFNAWHHVKTATPDGWRAYYDRWENVDRLASNWSFHQKLRRKLSDGGE